MAFLSPPSISRYLSSTGKFTQIGDIPRHSSRRKSRLLAANRAIFPLREEPRLKTWVLALGPALLNTEPCDTAGHGSPRIHHGRVIP